MVCHAQVLSLLSKRGCKVVETVEARAVRLAKAREYMRVYMRAYMKRRRGEAKGTVKVKDSQERKLSKKIVNRIMELGLLLERAWGREVFKKRMSILYNTTVGEVECILESKVYIRRRIREDVFFLQTNDDTTVLRMAKQFLLNPATKDASLNKFLESVNEIAKEKGSGKKWHLREVGDKGDDQLKTYELKEE